MRVPESLAPLIDHGVISEVVRPLMSGKEAQIYLVLSGGEYAVAKIYKEAQNRTFKNRAEYTEGRKVRNTRDQRAIGKRSKHGREQDEAAWRSTEVDMIHRLHAAGVRVPVPYYFIDGVLIMELVVDEEGDPAPRLSDLPLEREEAIRIYDRLIREVVKMLCAGVVHGDLSEFNVLLGADGPVIIDFPQAVDCAHNRNAQKLLVRDVDNLYGFLTRLVPDARRVPYAQEMWRLYEKNLLTPDTKLRGDYRPRARTVDTSSVLGLIDDANRDERKRRDSLGLRGGPPQQSWGGPPNRGPGNNAQRGPGPRNNAPRSRQRLPEVEYIRARPPTGPLDDHRGAAPQPDSQPRRATPMDDRRPWGAREEAPVVRPRHDEPGQRQPREPEPRQQQSREQEPRQRPSRRRRPREQQPREQQPREQQPRQQQPREQQPRQQQPRDQQPRDQQPRQQQSRDQQPRQQQPREQQPRQQQPRQQQPRGEAARRSSPAAASPAPDEGAAPRRRRVARRNTT